MHLWKGTHKGIRKGPSCVSAFVAAVFCEPRRRMGNDRNEFSWLDSNFPHTSGEGDPIGGVKGLMVPYRSRVMLMEFNAVGIKRKKRRT